MTDQYEMDKRVGESESEYRQRLDTAAQAAGQSTHEFIKTQSQQAGRPPKVSPEETGAGREGTAGTADTE
jgi:hypothetical protein